MAKQPNLKITLANVAERFMAHCTSAVSLSEHTLRAYQGDLKDIVQYFGACCDIAAIDRDKLRQYIRYLRETRHFKETSTKRRIACFKLLFRWAEQESIVEGNPFVSLNEKIRLPKRLPRTLDRAEARLLREAITLSPRREPFHQLCHKTAIQLLLDTGIRVGELTSIDIDDLSLANRCIRIKGKGNRQRLVYLVADRLVDCLQRYHMQRLRISTKTARLLINLNGHTLTPPHIRLALRDIAAHSGIQRTVTPHMLRHTCATHWLESGLDIRYVQKLLGHQSISTTEIYTHVSDQGLRDALWRSACGGS
jgi:integrase/recombinase XerD